MRHVESPFKAIAPGLVLSVACGGVAGLAFPPLHLSLLVWVGLVPLFLAIRRAGTLRSSAAVGWLAGTVFFLLVLAPLVSSHEWTGWAALSREQLMATRSRQWWFMHGLWLSVSVAGGLLWAAFAAALKKWPLLCSSRGREGRCTSRWCRCCS